MTVASNYHIEVNPNDAGIYDRIVVQEMIKTIAQSQQLDINGQREFKGISSKQKYLLFVDDQLSFLKLLS